MYGSGSGYGSFDHQAKIERIVSKKTSLLVTDPQHYLQGTFTPVNNFCSRVQTSCLKEPTFGNAKSDHELAEVELLRENLLHVLVPLPPPS
jgi:hypothetical protein